MTTRLYSVFLALVLLIGLSACTTGEAPPKALEEGTIPIDQFHSEDGTFQYARLPIGISKEEAAKRLGVEDLGPIIAMAGDITNYSPANKITYEGQDVAVLLEFQGDGLTLVEFNFRSHEKETLAPIHEKLTEQLYELYGVYSASNVDRPPYYSKIFNWDTHLNGDLTRVSLHFYGSEQEDGSSVANLSVSVGKWVFANDTNDTSDTSDTNDTN